MTEHQSNQKRHSHTELQNLKPDFGIQLPDLVKVISAYQQERSFDQDVQVLEGFGGTQWIENGLKTNFNHGLSGDPQDLAERNMQFGNNKKPEIKTKSFLQLVWLALQDLTLRILLVASCVSIIIQEIVEEDHRETAWIEGFAIFVAVAVCATVAAANDYQKEKQFKKLNAVAEGRKEIKVIRNGAKVRIHQSDCMTGDIVVIEDGMPIPADALLIEGTDVETDESAMTGETDPIKKASLQECQEKRDQIVAEGGKHTADAHSVPSPILMSGTRILQGTGKFVILVVGDESCEGKISKILRQQEAQATPLQEKLEAIAQDIGKFGLWSAIFIVLILLLRFFIERGMNRWNFESSHAGDILRYFIIGVAVIVVAIPEGLPLSVTISLAYSVKKMLKDQNLVRKLQACETMGGADVICSDKTGTLTQNQMTLTCLWNEKEVKLETYKKTSLGTFIPESHQELFINGMAVNSEAEVTDEAKGTKESGSKTEIAMLKFLNLCSINYEEQRQIHKKIAAFNFTSKRKRMSVILDEHVGGISQRRLHIKGASELVLQCCTHFHSFSGQIRPIDENQRQIMEKAIEAMASQALRTIVMAYKDLDGSEDLHSMDEKGVRNIEKSNLTCIAILGIKDILREQVPGAVAQCHRAGITVKMVTGDFKITARAIAKECGIIKAGDEESLVLEGAEFMERVGGLVCKTCNTQICDCPKDQQQLKEMEEKGKKNLKVREDVIYNKEEFKKIYKKLNVLARSRPEDKYTLVAGLKELGHVVAVTGDGTNDAPALKKADVGFAMGIAGTEVAREASSIILLDDNFNSIVAAVLWGRNIYDSIRKFLQFQLTVNVVAVFLTLIGAATIKDEVLSPIQMLWVNLIMDSLASLALATEPPRKELLERKPHGRDDYIISRKMFKHILGQAILQLTILLILTYLTQDFIPEYSDDMDDKILSEHFKEATVYNQSVIAKTLNQTVEHTKNKIYERGCFGIKYSNPKGECRPDYMDPNGKGDLIRSGRMKAYSDSTNLFSKYNVSENESGGIDYQFIQKLGWVGPSRHFTFVFNTFVWLQIFNFLNARVLDDSKNIFKGILRNRLFLLIVGIIIVLQIIICTFGNVAFQCYSRFGLNAQQYLICIGFAAIGLIWSFLLKFIPENKLPQVGKKQASFRKDSLSFKRNNSKRQSFGLVGDRQEGSYRIGKAVNYAH